MVSIIVFTFIIAQAVVAIYLFNTLKTKDNFEKNLNATLIILSFHLGVKIFMLVVVKNVFLFSNNATGFGLSYGPLLYITARTYLQRPLHFRSVAGHLFPFFLFTIMYFINCAGYIFDSFPGDYINEYAFIYQWLVAASLLIYPLLTINLFKKYRHPGIDRKPDNRLALLRSMSYVMITGVVLGLIAVSISFIIKGYHDFDIRMLPYTCLIVIPLFILRYKMQTIMPGEIPAASEKNEIGQEEEVALPEKRYKKSALDVEMMDQYETGLKYFMTKTKIYLEPEISLEELADKVKIPKHHLTQLLNERFQKNFYAFINEYRIAEAIEKLKNPDSEVSILSLAYDCGFNSKSSFNNYFKKVTGLTPSAYRKEHVLAAAV